MESLKPLPVVGATRYSDLLRKFWVSGVLALLVINSFVVDFFLFRPSTPGQPSTNLPLAIQNACPAACVASMNSLFSSSAPNPTSAQRQAQTAIPTSIPTSAPTVVPTPTPSPVLSREVFIPLGSGSGNPLDWTSVDGVAATIDPSQYGSIKNAIFEITLNVPTANQTVWARLISIGNYAEVPGSEVSMTGGPTNLLVSSPLTLPGGSNLYQVQLKTQLQYPVYIEQARIRIDSN